MLFSPLGDEKAWDRHLPALVGLGRALDKPPGVARSLLDARDILDELTKRNVKLSLGGSISRSHRSGGPAAVQRARDGRRVRIRPDPDANPGGDEDRQGQRPASR